MSPAVATPARSVHPTARVWPRHRSSRSGGSQRRPVRASAGTNGGDAGAPLPSRPPFPAGGKASDPDIKPPSPPPGMTAVPAPKQRGRRKSAAPAAASDTKRRRPSKRRELPLDRGSITDATSAASVSISYGTDTDDDVADGGTYAARRPRHDRRSSAAGASSPAAPVAPSAEAPLRLSSKLPRGTFWSSVRQWVVFSDLHVRESSLATCLEVLRAVAVEAGKREAGVMFLGDFWDRRGALPVEPLNQVLQEMASWRFPVLMLVGNHDQVDLGGLQHGLTPLELACPHVHVFDEPTLWHGALWLPYRRETWVLERAMAQAVEAAAAATGAGSDEGTGQGRGGARPLNAIFLHADVRTARTNQWRQAEEGLEPGAFPPHLAVYSGHYHLPHTVQGTNITYIGSPYQVSLSEASETKRLLVLEATSWSVVEEIPLSLGPRHMRLSGPAACDQLRNLAVAAAAAAAAASSATGSNSGADATASDASGSGSDGGHSDGDNADGVPPPQSPPALRRGDRVKLWLSAAEAQDERIVQAMAELERAGVSVEQVLQPEVRAARVTAAEGLTAEQMVELYCSGGGGAGQGLSEAAAAAVRAAVAQARDAAGAGDDVSRSAGRCVELELESVRLRGFGPFVEEQTYPLAARGVRVLVGENRDEPGADSNGAGKTSLVTAPLWALAGEVLARSESGGGGRVPVDVMRNDRCGSCVVGLSGRLDGELFEVVREVKRGKTSGLSLQLGGEDLTLQDISGTAERIRRLFATDLLRSSAFFGQNDITGLLEANDAALKQKLGLVVDLEVWEAARQLLTGPRKAAAAAAAEEAGRARVLAAQRERRAAEVAELQGQEAEWAAEHERRLVDLREVSAQRAREVAAAAQLLAPRAMAARGLVSELRLAAAAAEEQLRRGEAELDVQQAAARRAAEMAATAAAATSPPRPPSRPPSSSLLQSQLPQPTAAVAALEHQHQQAQLVDEEQEAARVLLERQAEVTRLQQLLTDRQAAASLALGRLRQLESSLREYQEAVARAAAASTLDVGTVAATANATAAPPAAAASLGSVSASPVQGPSAEQLAAPQLPQRLLRTVHGDTGHGGGGSNNGRENGSAGGLLLEWTELGGDGSGGNRSGGGGRAAVVAGPAAGSASILAVCDRCRQPINEEQYGANVARLQGGVDEARQVYDKAAAEEREAQAAHAAAANHAAEVNMAVLELQRRRIEWERRAAAEARVAAAAAEREARAAEEAASRAREAVWQAAEGLLRGVQAGLAASSRARGDLLSAAADLERVVSEVDQATATWALHAAASASAADGPLISCTDGNGTYGGTDVRADTVPGGVTAADGNAGAAAATAPERSSEELLAAARGAAAAGRSAAAAAVGALASWREAAAALQATEREANPRSALRIRALRELEELERQQAEAEEAAAAAEAHMSALTDADRALGRSGIPSLLLEEVLAQLQAYTARYLNELCDGFVLELSATKPAAGGGRCGGTGGAGRGAGAGGGGREKEEISRVIKVRSAGDGSLRQRDVRQLSGGERRRVALALCLGFEELVRRRRRLVCNVMVLDEVLQQLDNTGCERVARVLRDLPHASVLIVGQSNSSVTANFELMDVVVKEAGAARVRLAA